MVEANAAVSVVIDRQWNRPSLYRSTAEYERTLADAYRARAAVWTDVIEYRHANPDAAPGLLIFALLQARDYNEDAARDCEREARRAEQRDEERAQLAGRTTAAA